jgi:DNA-binding protein H-NS
LESAGPLRKISPSGYENMKANNLTSMSVDDLWTLHQEICTVLAKRLAEEKAALEERLRQLKPEGAAGSFQRAKRPYPQVFPKFRNPAQPAETWSGRGKQPRWLTAQLRSGKKLTDFLIQPSVTGARRRVDRKTSYKRAKRA